MITERRGLVGSIFLFIIPEFLGSNLGSETDYPDWGFS
jgi:hypothetical protein